MGDLDPTLDSGEEGGDDGLTAAAMVSGREEGARRGSGTGQTGWAASRSVQVMVAVVGKEERSSGEVGGVPARSRLESW